MKYFNCCLISLTVLLESEVFMKTNYEIQTVAEEINLEQLEVNLDQGGSSDWAY